jgi:hypothetical protein
LAEWCFSLNQPFKEATLNLSSNLLSRKTRFFRLRPSRREGLRIQYQIKDTGKSLCDIGRSLNIVHQVVSGVVSGRRRSARVEAEIARILGKPDWNEVVLEARSAVTGKPVNELVDEINRKLQARDAAFASGLAAAKAKADAPRPADPAPAARRAV